MFEARYTTDSGTTETQQFAEYTEMCQWLARHAEAGIEAWEDGETMDQRQLQEDVEQYL